MSKMCAEEGEMFGIRLMKQNQLLQRRSKGMERKGEITTEENEGSMKKIFERI